MGSLISHTLAGALGTIVGAVFSATFLNTLKADILAEIKKIKL